MNKQNMSGKNNTAEKIRAKNERDQKIFEKRVLIGWIMIILGLISMYALGVSYYHEYAWIGFAIVIGGFIMITGFSGIIGCILGGLLEGMISSANTADVAKRISMTQTDLERRNLMFDKDVLGQKLERPFKK
ncbi:MAG: hypothetical protein J5662_04480 [Clostridia bacterium]|nr:hypothetical protein [Clostridia bacterium]